MNKSSSRNKFSTYLTILNAILCTILHLNQSLCIKFKQLLKSRLINTKFIESNSKLYISTEWLMRIFWFLQFANARWCAPPIFNEFKNIYAYFIESGHVGLSAWKKKLNEIRAPFWMHSFGRNFSIQMNVISEKNYGFLVHTNCLLPTIFESYHLVFICFQGLCCFLYEIRVSCRFTNKTNNMHNMIHRFFSTSEFSMHSFLSSSCICTEKLQTREFSFWKKKNNKMDLYKFSHEKGCIKSSIIL